MEKVMVLKGLLNRSRYLTYAPALQKLTSFGEEPTTILKAIESYYDSYPDQEKISVDELRTYFDLNWPKIKNPEIYQEYLSNMASVDVGNEALLVESLNKIVGQDICSEIALEAEEGMISHTDQILKIGELIEQYKEITGTIEQEGDEEISLDLDALMEEEKTFDVHWRLPFLRETLGRPKPGTLGQIFACPETGKSSFGISEATHFARQFKDPGDKVLYMNNEEPIQRLAIRMYSAGLKRTMDQILKHKNDAKKWFLEKIAPNMVCRGQVYTIYQVEEYLKRYSPKIAIIDQGPKVNLPQSDASDVKKLQLIYERYRRLASQYDCMIVSMAQADADAAGKRWLSLENLYYSKVGVQGELDFAVGIGIDKDQVNGPKRYLNVCKNKLTGTHARKAVYFDKEKCLYKEMGSGGGNNEQSG
jgi:KaiC/GvpD/RAD55 family RecA-like ATPase